MSDHEEEIVLPDFFMPDLAPVVTRLEAAAIGLAYAATVMDWQSSVDRVRAAPAAMVTPFGATYGDNLIAAKATRQERTHFFSVMLVFTQVGPDGIGGLSLFEQVRKGTVQALTGWRHPGGGSLVVPVAERLAHFDAQRQALTYEVRFKHRHHVSNLTPSP